VAVIRDSFDKATHVTRTCQICLIYRDLSTELLDEVLGLIAVTSWSLDEYNIGTSFCQRDGECLANCVSSAQILNTTIGLHTPSGASSYQCSPAPQRNKSIVLAILMMSSIDVGSTTILAGRRTKSYRCSPKAIRRVPGLQPDEIQPGGEGCGVLGVTSS